jgi:AcrR family transcriptional regulator
MMEERRLPVRERILLTAGLMFYRDGIRAVGIDAIIAESGVAKMSLYRSFPSKDALIVAWLERLDEAYWRRWQAAEAKGDDARAKLAALLDMIGTRVCDPRWRGCAFLNTATEFPHDHPATEIVLRNKRRVHERLSALAADAGAPVPGALADRLQLLIDGAYVLGQLFGKDGPARNVAEAGRAVIADTLGITPHPAPPRSP